MAPSDRADAAMPKDRRRPTWGLSGASPSPGSGTGRSAFFGLIMFFHFEGWKMYQPQSGEYDCSSLTGVEDKATYEQEWREEDNYVFDCSTLPEQYTECLLMTYTNE